MESNVIREAEIRLLLNNLIDKYGYDFTGYSPASLSRRIERLYAMDKFPSFAEFRFAILNDPEYFRRLVEEISVNADRNAA